MTIAILVSCQQSSEPEITVPSDTIKPKENRITVKLFGPGDRGNYFKVASDDISIRGKCFDAHINGVYGFGRFILDDDKPYNLWGYFHRRHSPSGDRELIKKIVPGKTVPVDFKISKCGKNGYYDKSEQIANFIGQVTVKAP